MQVFHLIVFFILFDLIFICFLCLLRGEISKWNKITYLTFGQITCGFYLKKKKIQVDKL